MLEEIISFYSKNHNRWSESYTDLNEGNPHQKQVAINLIKELGGNGSKILDVGCGTGHILSEVYSDYLFLTGIDISESMLNHAYKLKEILRLDSKKIKFQRKSFNDFLNGNICEYDVFSFIGYFVHHENNLIEHLELIKEKSINLKNYNENKKIYVVSSFKNKLFGMYAINQRSRELFKDLSKYSYDVFNSIEDQEKSLNYFEKITKEDFSSGKIDKQESLKAFKGEHVLEVVKNEFKKVGFQIESTIFANPHSLPPSIGSGIKGNMKNSDLVELTNKIQDDWRSQFTCSMFFIVASIKI